MKYEVEVFFFMDLFHIYGLQISSFMNEQLTERFIHKWENAIHDCLGFHMKTSLIYIIAKSFINTLTNIREIFTLFIWNMSQVTSIDSKILQICIFSVLFQKTIIINSYVWLCLNNNINDKSTLITYEGFCYLIKDL
jgi:transcription termination factor NusB